MVFRFVRRTVNKDTRRAMVSELEKEKRKEEAARIKQRDLLRRLEKLDNEIAADGGKKRNSTSKMIVPYRH
jgi:hypothetical protein